MNDMSSTIIAKSDQINAADLIGTSRTITVKEVRIKAGEDQPVTILIEGENKAFRPCKGVRRLLVRVWGTDANKYIGQSLTIYCDPKVIWAGTEAGGIRVSHMSGLDEKIVEYMRINRAGTKPYEIKPLIAGPIINNPRAKAEAWVKEHTDAVENCESLDELDGVIADNKRFVAKLDSNHKDLREMVMDAYSARGESFEAAIAAATAALATDTGDGFADEGEE